MGACHSSKDKNKKEGDVIKANDPNKKDDDKKTQEKDEEKKEEDKNNDKENNDDKKSNKNDNEKKEEDKDNEKDSDSSSDKDSPKPQFEEINVIYILKGEEKYSKKYSTLVRIATLFDILYEKENKYSDFDLLTSEMVSLKSHLNDRICKIFPDKDSIELNLFYMGLEISDDVLKDSEISTTIIATPLFDISDNLGFVLYNKYSKKLSCTILNNDENKDLNVFTQLSSFCNGNNMLYISGGEAKNSVSESPFLNDFYCINLLDIKKSHKLPNLNEARALHSMIFIPPKFVFIVSGTTNSVELFNTEKNEIQIDSMLNEKRCEPTLICLNNAMLFAFCGFVIGDSFLSTIEKCNLRNSRRLWTYVNYQTLDNVIFEECYYVASYFSESSIILFGSDESQKKNFQNIMFDLEDEENPTISLYQSEIKITDVCPEKYFHSISGGCSLMFPLISGEVIMYKIDENAKLSKEEYPDILEEIQ